MSSHGAESIHADPIAPAVHALIALFQDELSGVQFPGIDSERLEAKADEVRERAQVVADAVAELERAREALGAEQAALNELCQRGLAYARVFAEGDLDLTEKLAALVVPTATKPVERRPKARKSEPPKKAGKRRLTVTQNPATEDEDDDASELPLAESA